MTYTEKRLKFEEEVAKELGYVSALFMSQECKGTEIVMPSTELKEVADRIGLYAFTSIAQALAEDRERVRGEVNKFTVYYRSKFSRDCSRDETEEEKSTEMIELATLLSSLDKPLTDKE